MLPGGVSSALGSLELSRISSRLSIASRDSIESSYREYRSSVESSQRFRNCTDKTVDTVRALVESIHSSGEGINSIETSTHECLQVQFPPPSYSLHLSPSLQKLFNAGCQRLFIAWLLLGLADRDTFNATCSQNRSQRLQ